jgi:pyruvate,water dikinase
VGLGTAYFNYMLVPNLTQLPFFLITMFTKVSPKISKKAIPEAGGKGASLGEMSQNGFPVPSGFVVLANAFERFLAETDVNAEIEAMWDRINIESTDSVEENSTIITNVGGLTCHAAIVSRELGIPCIIGTKIAAKVLKDGDLVEVDANKGVVKILKRSKS